MSLRLTFLGAAGTVTGSRFLLESGGTRVLVDCGLFQGLKTLRLRNREPFPVPPASLDAVVLTHAHLDHSGFLPVLVKQGFAGAVYCTPPTIELTRILLEDSGRLQEEDAAYANRQGFSRHHPALPLYTEEDAIAACDRLEAVAYEQPFAIGGFSFRLRQAGHILGGASVTAEGAGTRVVFSGDVGRPHDRLLYAPLPPPAADAIVMESTYGDRLHDDVPPDEAFAEAVRRTAARGGVVLIPSFAVGRAQAVLHLLHRLRESGDIPPVPVYLNSPMALDVTVLYRRFSEEHRLSVPEITAAFRDVKLVRSVEASKELNRRRGPMVIVAGAGMLTGGRILHHLKAFGDDPRTTLLLVGYQAAGTRGADLLAGARSLKVHGGHVDVRAEVIRLDGFSAHADRDELIDWLRSAQSPPAHVHLVHGEPVPADAMRRELQERLRIPASVAEHLSAVEPGGGSSRAAVLAPAS